MSEKINEPCFVQTPQGFSVSYNERLLYSKYNPSKAIIQSITNLTIQPGTLVLCNSPVLDYGLSELSEKLPQNCFLLLCEADSSLFNFENETLQELPENTTRLSLSELNELPLILQKSSYTFESGKKFLPSGSFRRVIRLDFSAGVQFHSQYYEEVFQACVTSLRTFWINRITLTKFGRRYSKNFFTNLHNLPKTTPIQAFFNSIEKPVLVLGAGESINKTLQDLSSKSNSNNASLRDSFFIICADTALQPCIKHGIIPDGVFIEEAQSVITKAFIGALRKDIHIFAGLSSLPLLSKLYKPSQISYFTTLYTNASFIENLTAKQLLPPQNQPMGSVGLTAVYYALKFRKNNSIPVLVSGLDFSYSVGVTHAKGTMAHTQRLLSMNRLQSIQNYGAAFSEASQAITDKAGNKMITTPSLQGYANLFSNMFAKEENLYDIGECGTELGIPKGSIISFKNDTCRQISKKNNAEAISQKDLERFFEEERQTLLTLRDILSGKIKISPSELESKIKELAVPREYLYLHFPDGHNFTYTSAFLNRLRAEIDFFLKYI